MILDDRLGSKATVRRCPRYFRFTPENRHSSPVMGSPGPPRHRSALQRCEMAADQSVLVPDQSHHDNIEDRQHDEAGAARVRETVELVDDEQAKDDKRNRISPEFISEQTDDEEDLNDAVAEEIEGIEALGADGKILRQA